MNDVPMELPEIKSYLRAKISERLLSGCIRYLPISWQTRDINAYADDMIEAAYEVGLRDAWRGRLGIDGPDSVQDIAQHLG